MKEDAMTIISEKEFKENESKTAIVRTSIDLEQYPTNEELEAIKNGLDAYDRGDYTIIKNPNNIWESIL